VCETYFLPESIGRRDLAMPSFCFFQDICFLTVCQVQKKEQQNCNSRRCAKR